MTVLHLESLPPRSKKSDVLHWLNDLCGLHPRRIGKVDMHGHQAVVEIPLSWSRRVVKQLDGAEVGRRKISAWIGAAPDSAADREDHFLRLARLLDLESAAEALELVERMDRMGPKEAERSGNSLIDMVVHNEHGGLGSRYILTMVKRNRDLGLPWTKLSIGRPVVLSSGQGAEEMSLRGVVCGRDRRRLEIALNFCPRQELGGIVWRIDQANDEQIRLRQQAMLERVRASSGDRLAEFRRIFLGEQPPGFTTEQDFLPLNQQLDPSQQAAVRFGLSARDVALIHGPPGTGKTTALVELVRQAARAGEKVLVCGPSNMAVDNLLEGLLHRGEAAVRLGHPARVLPELRTHTLDYLVEAHENSGLVRKLVRKAQVLRRQATKWTRARPEPGAKRQLIDEADGLLEDASRIEAQVVESILNSSSVVCATTTGIDSQILGKRQFDLAVLDEACQSTEPGCWMPLLRARKLILAGDHCQLPPTVVSKEASEQGFAISMFERLFDLYGMEITSRLNIQYRMNSAIMDFSSMEFYEAELEADASVSTHLLRGLDHVSPSEITGSPVAFIDTAGAGYDEIVEPDGVSRYNPQEAELIVRQTEALMEAGLKPQEMAIIAPYSAQVRHLRERIALPGLEIDSVDGFQGREKEAILISLVRSNPEGEMGFLGDVRRTNVALTRARRKLIVVGDSATLSALPFYQRLFEYFDSIGAYSTVWEEMA